MNETKKYLFYLYKTYTSITSHTSMAKDLSTSLPVGTKMQWNVYVQFSKNNTQQNNTNIIIFVKFMSLQKNIKYENYLAYERAIQYDFGEKIADDY